MSWARAGVWGHRAEGAPLSSSLSWWGRGEGQRGRVGRLPLGGCPQGAGLGLVPRSGGPGRDTATQFCQEGRKQGPAEAPAGEDPTVLQGDAVTHCVPSHRKSLDSAAVPGSGDSKVGQGEGRAPIPFTSSLSRQQGSQCRPASASEPLPPGTVLAMESGSVTGAWGGEDAVRGYDPTGLEEGEGQCHPTRGLVPLVWS